MPLDLGPQVSAKTDELNIVMGLNSGSNDFVCKPYNRSELLARISAQLRMKKVLFMNRMPVCELVGGTGAPCSSLCMRSCAGPQHNRYEKYKSHWGLDLILTRTNCSRRTGSTGSSASASAPCFGGAAQLDPGWLGSVPSVSTSRRTACGCWSSRGRGRRGLATTHWHTTSCATCGCCGPAVVVTPGCIFAHPLPSHSSLLKHEWLRARPARFKLQRLSAVTR